MGEITIHRVIWSDFFFFFCFQVFCLHIYIFWEKYPSYSRQITTFLLWWLPPPKKTGQISTLLLWWLLPPKKTFLTLFFFFSFFFFREKNVFNLRQYHRKLLAWRSLHNYKIFVEWEGKDQGWSLYEGALHTYDWGPKFDKKTHFMKEKKDHGPW